jgi:hypothetical protein
MHTGFSIPLIIHPQYGSVQSTGFSLDSLIIKYGFVESIGFDLSHAPIGYGTTETSGFSIYPLNPVYGAVVQIGFGLPVPDYFFGVKVRGFSFPLQNPEFGLVENFGFEIGTETGYGFGLVENVGFEIGTETGYGFGLVENVGFNSPILNVEFGYKPVGFAVGMVGVGYGKIVSIVTTEWITKVKYAVTGEWLSHISSQIYTASEFTSSINTAITSEWGASIGSAVAVSSEWITPVFSSFNVSSEFNTKVRYPVNTSHQSKIGYKTATASEWGTEIESLPLTQTASEWVAVAQSPIASAWQEFVFNEKATASEWGTEIESLLPTASEWGISLFHKDESQVLSEWNTSVIGFQPPIDIILDDNHIIDEKGRRIEISDISVSIDVDSFAWSGQTSLLTYHEYSRLKTGDIIHVYLQGILFVFEVQPKSHEYSSSPEVGLSIRLLSPCARLNREQISGEFFGTAKDICESIAGLSIQWNTLNWVIPRGLLIVNSQSRAEVIKNILSAAGSILQTLPNGELIAQPITPQPLNALTASKSKKLTDVQHILSFSESFPDSLKYYNSCRLSNYRGDELQYEYKMEYIESESVVRAYGEPFDDTIQLSHTSSHPIFIGAGRNVLVNTCQQVEFKEGQGQVNHPIDTINNVVWKTKPLDINGFSGRTVIASIINQHGFGIADIQYTYRAIDFPVSFSNQDKQVAQILLSASDKKSQHHDIEVKRGAGDKPRKEDIISPLSDLPALLLKGRVEIDIGENWPVVSMQIRFDGNISVGQSVAIFDRLLGVERLGVVMSVAHGYTKTFITQISVMLKP